MKRRARHPSLGKRCLLCLWNFFFPFSFSLYALFIPFAHHPSLTISPLSILFFLDLLMCIVIRSRSRSRCSSSLGFEAWMYSLPS